MADIGGRLPFAVRGIGKPPPWVPSKSTGTATHQGNDPVPD